MASPSTSTSRRCRASPAATRRGTLPATPTSAGRSTSQDCNDAVTDRYGQNNLLPDRLVPQLGTGVDYPVGKRVAPFGRTGRNGHVPT